VRSRSPFRFTERARVRGEAVRWAGEGFFGSAIVTLPMGSSLAGLNSVSPQLCGISLSRLILALSKLKGEEDCAAAVCFRSEDA
jgi:hypothetical protein